LSKLTQSAKGKDCIRCGAPDAYAKLQELARTKIVIDYKTGCHVWNGARCGNGYGYITLRNGKNKKNYLLHRVVYEIEAEESVVGKVVMHTCDNPSCCNIMHLMLGDRSQNTKDMVSKNRHPKHMKKCDENVNRKLSKESIAAILSSTLSSRTLCKEYGVHHSTISRIKANGGY
jgi:hypothetical protein